MGKSRQKVRIGLVGYGVMGRAHSYAYRVAQLVHQLPVDFDLRVIAGRNQQAVARAADAFGFSQSETDWRRVVEDPAVDVVDICTPPNLHPEIAAAAAANGKAVLSEKPLGVSYAGACLARDAAQAAGVLNAIGFNYRRLPALALMKRMVADGSIGSVRLWRGIWLSDEFADPLIPYDWRFEREQGASTIVDLGIHLADLARWMVGDVTSVVAQSTTFTRARPDPAGTGERDVHVDDASSALLAFTNGARGVFEVAKVAVRRPCDFMVEVDGSDGTLMFDYRRLNELWFGASSDEPRAYGMKLIRAEHVSHPYAKDWWPIGQGIGYGASFVNELGDLFAHWPEGPWIPDFDDAVRAQAICEAIERSAARGTWIALAEVT